MWVIETPLFKMIFPDESGLSQNLLCVGLLEETTDWFMLDCNLQANYICEYSSECVCKPRTDHYNNPEKYPNLIKSALAWSQGTGHRLGLATK